MGAKRPELLTAAEIEEKSGTFSHPWNPNSEISGAQLGRLTGLKRTGVNLARIAPGKESFILHSHQMEEEWIYILSGHATAQVGDDQVEVGPGDFLGFPAPSVAHHVRNTGPETLVYLMGGEHREVEIADYPGLGKRLVRNGEELQIYDIADARPFGPL